MDSYLIHLGGDNILKLSGEGAAATFGLVAMDDAGEGIHGLSVYQHLELDHTIGPVASGFVIERSVAPGDGFDLVVEVDKDFVEREDGGDHDPAGIDRVGALHNPAFVHHDLHDVADILVWNHDEALHDRFADFFNDTHVGKIGGVVDHEGFSVGLHHLIDDARIGRDDIHVVFTAEALDDDLHVKESQEAASKAEPKGDGALGHVVECGVVDLELAHGGLELLEVGSIDRVDSTEDHRLNFLESGEGFGGGLFGVGQRIADLNFGGALDVADEVADITRSHRPRGRHLRGEDANLLNLIGLVGRHELHLGAGLEISRENPDIADNAAISIEERIEDEGSQRTVSLRWWGDTMNDRLQDIDNSDAGLGASGNRLLGRDGQKVLQLFFDRW